MLVLWRPPRINERDWQLATRAWRLYGEQLGQPLVTDDWVAFKHCIAWDKIPEQADQTIIWALPHFVPAPSMMDELAGVGGEGYRVAVQRSYVAVFSQGDRRPALWTPEGVSRAFVAFLPKTRHWVLPPVARVKDIWDWLASDHPKVFHADAHWVDDRARSIFGLVYPELWGGGDLGVAGRTVSGNTYWFDRTAMLAAWREALEGWHTWLKKRS